MPSSLMRGTLVLTAAGTVAAWRARIETGKDAASVAYSQSTRASEDAARGRSAAAKRDCACGGEHLRVGTLHEPLGELAAPPLGVESHHVAIVVDLLDRTAWLGVISATPSGHRHVAVDRHGLVGSVVGALLVPGRGAFVLPLAEPRVDDGTSALDGLVIGVVAVRHVVAEERADRLAVVRLPRLDVGGQPAVDAFLVHRSSSQRSARRSSLPDAVRGSSETNSKRFGTLWEASDSVQCRRRSSGLAATPSRSTTNAVTSSCHFASGRPTAAASATSGWRSRTSSTSAGSTFSPPETITSPSLSSTYRKPSSSIRPRSPVCSQPSSSAQPGATTGPCTRISPSWMRRCVVSSGRPAEPSLRCASLGVRVVTCEAASVRP